MRGPLRARAGHNRPMPQITIALGSLLILIGVGFYFGTGATSVTALIPAFLGIPMAVAGVLARRESLRKHAMHAAVLARAPRASSDRRVGSCSSRRC